MKKCQTCIWSDWRSGTKVFCPFPRCVKPKKSEEEHCNSKEATIKDEVNEVVSKHSTQ
jgi:hypothetical protein